MNKKKFDLSGKIAIVTGGGNGIGKAIALTLAAFGAKVDVLDLKKRSAQETVSEIKAYGGKAEAYKCDVSKNDNVRNIFDKIFDKEKSVHILINNAGIGHIGNIEKTNESDMDRLFRINVMGVFNCIQASISNFKRNGCGVILNIASIASSVGIPDRFAYSMSKGAVLSMTYSVAKDFIGSGIRCNSISPARVHTSFVDDFLTENYPGMEEVMFRKLSRSQPIGRMATPQEVADFALFLCSDEASFITGNDFPIDGGFIKLQAS